MATEEIGLYDFGAAARRSIISSRATVSNAH